MHLATRVFHLESSQITNVHFHPTAGACKATPTIEPCLIDGGDWNDEIASGGFRLYICYEGKPFDTSYQTDDNPVRGMEEASLDAIGNQYLQDNTIEMASNSISLGDSDTASTGSIIDYKPPARNRITKQREYRGRATVDERERLSCCASNQNRVVTQETTEGASPVSEVSRLSLSNWRVKELFLSEKPLERLNRSQPSHSYQKDPPGGILSSQMPPSVLPAKRIADFTQISNHTPKDRSVTKNLDVGNLKIGDNGDHRHADDYQRAPTGTEHGFGARPGPIDPQKAAVNKTHIRNSEHRIDTACLPTRLSDFADVLREHGERQPRTPFFVVGESMGFLSLDGYRRGAVIARCWAPNCKRIELYFANFDKQGFPLNTDRPKDLPISLTERTFPAYEHKIKWEDKYVPDSIADRMVTARWEWLKNKVVNQYSEELLSGKDDTRRQEFLRSSARIRLKRRPDLIRDDETDSWVPTSSSVSSSGIE